MAVPWLESWTEKQQQKEEGRLTHQSALITLLPDYACNVPLLLWLPCNDGLHAQTGSHNKPFLLKLLQLGIFCQSIRKVMKKDTGGSRTPCFMKQQSPYNWPGKIKHYNQLPPYGPCHGGQYPQPVIQNNPSLLLLMDILSNQQEKYLHCLAGCLLAFLVFRLVT